MENFLTPELLAQLAQIGGQYLLPVAALLRALYHGVRGKVPEGAVEIGAASIITGLTAAADNPNAAFQAILGDIFNNAVFMAGLLAFIVIYLLRIRFFSLFVDGVIGSLVGFVAWFVWGLLMEDWPAWTIPVMVAGGAAGFITLRYLLRQVLRLLRVATYFIALGLIFVLGAGAIWLLANLGGVLDSAPLLTPSPF